MSKHLGNVVSPFEMLDKFGADPVRWYFYTTTAPWLPKRFSEDAVREVQSKFLGTLRNTYSFFAMYAQIDNFDPTAHPLAGVQLSLMDKWILSRLNSLIRQVDADLQAYRIGEPCAAIEKFVDDLSNWYIRRCRPRFWGKGMAGDKEAAFATLYHVLVTLAQVIAPFVPFISEEIWQNLVVNNVPGAAESVHLSDYPMADEAAIDPEMEEQMEALRQVVTLGLSDRNRANLKVRQPLQHLYVKGAAFAADYQALCAEELNVKEVIFTEDARAFTTYQLKPQMRTLGKKYGKLLGKIGEYLKTLDGNDVVDAFARGELLTFELEGTTVELAAEDVLTAPMQKPGFVALEDHGITVVLDTNLTEALINEGYAREVISKLQNMRKDAGFEVTDRIVVRYACGDKLADAIAAAADMIMAGTLALKLERAGVQEGDYSAEWSINGEQATLAVCKA